MELEEPIFTDFSIHFNGSINKLVKCLDLLQIIVTSKRLVIAIDKSTLENLATKLYSLCSQEDLSEKSLMCLLEILKRNHELAFATTTKLFIEMHCHQEVKNSWSSYVSYLICWLKILKLMKYTGSTEKFEPILEYISRIPSLPETKV